MFARFAAAVATLIAAALIAVAPIASAQEAAPDPGPDSAPLSEGELDVLDAHIEGSGPWTSWFGGAPDRTLVLVLGNRGPGAVVDPELVLTFGRGSEPTDPLLSPEVERLEAGETTVVRVELDLPRFAIGTFAVEGSFPGSELPLRFRAETSHIPWVLVLLPLLALTQLSLLWIRNRVRRRIHQPATEVAAVAPTPPPTIDLRTAVPEPVDLETIVKEELDTVFDDAFRRHDEILDDVELRERVLELAGTAAQRVTDRAELSDDERAQLGLEMTGALLATFDLTAPSPV